MNLFNWQPKPLRTLSLLTLVLGGVPLVAGCNGDDTATVTSDSGSTTTPETTGDSDSTTGTATDSDSATTDATDGTTTGTDPTTTATTTTSTTSTVDPQPDGSMCANDAECLSNSCFVVPLLGGLCGECKVDADCKDGGCTIPNPLAGVGAACNSGEPGAGCESDEVCSDENNSYCGLVLDATPILKVQTCGECRTNDECGGETPNCSPTISVADFSGINQCVADGTVPTDSACNYVEEDGVPLGNAACESGKCGVAVVENVIKIGVCGECFVDQDCDEGTCQDAYLDTETGDLVGAKCG